MDRQKAGGQPVTLDMVMGDLLAAAYQDGKAGRSADNIQQLCDEWDRRHADDPVALKAGILCRSELMRAYRLGQAAGRRMDRVERSSSPAPPEKYITEWRTTEMELMHDYLRAARIECSRCHVATVFLSDVGLPAGAGDQLRGGIFAGCFPVEQTGGRRMRRRTDDQRGIGCANPAGGGGTAA